MPSKKDLNDKHFGRLHVRKFVGHDQLGKAIWLCQCDCGNITKIRGDSLTNGNTTTCGHCQINEYEIINKIVIGKTSNGQTFIFDSEDIMLVKKYTWRISKNGYVVSNLEDSKGLYLHKLLLDEINGLIVDHISRNKLDNRKSNLRYVTYQQNLFNRNKNINNSTGYKGVYYDKSRKKFVAEITCSYKKHFIGRFYSALEAAKAYNQKAIELFGEYAFLNDV